MNPKQTYDDSEDPNKFPDIVSWVKMGKDDIHFVCKLCKTGLLKLSTMGITIVRGFINILMWVSAGLVGF